MVKPTIAPLIGRRESKKREKLDRIKAAAYELFSANGYDATTVREIAAHAGVGFGTLFAYATEKRHLLFLLYDDISRDVMERAFRAAEKPGGLLDRMIAIFGPLYRLWARNPRLSRALLAELTVTTDPVMPHRFTTFDRETFVAQLSAIVRLSKAAGEIRSVADPERIARVMFSLFAGAVRLWLTKPAPVATAGIAELRSEFDLLIHGLEPSKAPRRA